MVCCVVMREVNFTTPAENICFNQKAMKMISRLPILNQIYFWLLFRKLYLGIFFHSFEQWTELIWKDVGWSEVDACQLFFLLCIDAKWLTLTSVDTIKTQMTDAILTVIFRTYHRGTLYVHILRLNSCTHRQCFKTSSF